MTEDISAKRLKKGSSETIVPSTGRATVVERA
jgi:hypothetical protein